MRERRPGRITGATARSNGTTSKARLESTQAVPQKKQCILPRMGAGRSFAIPGVGGSLTLPIWQTRLVRVSPVRFVGSYYTSVDSTTSCSVRSSGPQVIRDLE
jgi:hypothetical protein